MTNLITKVDVPDSFVRKGMVDTVVFINITDIGKCIEKINP